MSNENDKRPAFQFYPSDWLSDPNVQSMTAEQEGAYIHILATMWTTKDCSLPNDEEYLSRIGRVDKVVIRALLPCYKVVGDRLRHKRLDYERKKQDEFRQKCSIGGKEGMKKRWKKATPDKVVIRSDNSPSPSPSPSPSSNNSPISPFKNPVQKQGIKNSKKLLFDFLSKIIGKNLANLRTDQYCRKYPDDVIIRSLKNSSCVGETGFVKCADYYLKLKK